MKNRLKLILVLILCLIMTVSMPLSSYAETVDANGSSSQGTTGKGASSYNIKNAPKSDKTGVLFYLVDKNGNIVSSVLQTKSVPAGTLINMPLRFGNAKKETRQSITNWCNLPPFDAKASGNGRRMRDWLLMEQGENHNATILVQELWGDDAARKFLSEDQYLIIEPYMWCSLYKGSTYVADVCATTLGWAELQGKVGGNSYTSRYTIGNLPLSMYLDKDLPFMKKAPQVSTGKELDQNIIKTYGYGLVAVSAREAQGAPVEEPEKENGSYLDNEKIIVHTPVIAPVTIIDSEENKVYDDTAGTQLIHENLTSDREIKSKDGTTSDKKAAAELLLDETYTFKFDPALHREIQGYGWSGEPSKYDKYVYAKRVRFPFSVQVNGVFYEPVADDNHKDTDVHGKEHYYTDWITLYDRDVDGEGNVDAKTIKKFYIPPYAEESTYWEIEYRVEAYNVYDSRGNEHEDETEGTANTELQPNTAGKNYVATYKVPVAIRRTAPCEAAVIRG